MIARVWGGRTTAQTAGAYLRHFTDSVLPSLRGIAGFRGARVLRRETGREVEYLVVTHWESWGSIQAFAGDDPDKAVVEPEARTGRPMARFTASATRKAAALSRVKSGARLSAIARARYHGVPGGLTEERHSIMDRPLNRRGE